MSDIEANLLSAGQDEHSPMAAELTNVRSFAYNYTLTEDTDAWFLYSKSHVELEDQQMPNEGQEEERETGAGESSNLLAVETTEEPIKVRFHLLLSSDYEYFIMYLFRSSDSRRQQES